MISISCTSIYCVISAMLMVCKVYHKLKLSILKDRSNQPMWPLASLSKVNVFDKKPI